MNPNSINPFEMVFSLFLSFIAIIIVGLIIRSCFVMVREKSFKTTVLFGSRYFRTLKPGLHLKFPYPFEIAELPVEVKSLTKDRANITLGVRVQYVANEDKAYEAAYMLENPEMQIKSYIENTMRAQITTMNVEDVFSSTNEFESSVQQELETRFHAYGYNIINVLIDQPQLSKELTAAYQAKLVAVQLQEAATAEGEAIRIKMVAKANAEGESLVVKANAFKEFRKVVAEGNAEAINAFLNDLPDASITGKDVMQFFAGIDERDALRDVGQNGGRVVMITGQTNANPIAGTTAAIEAAVKDR
jgi:regulator of protease activity HflC (stomatin/prohibitin superfamily)